MQVEKRTKAKERVIVLSVGRSGYLQLAASHDSTDVRAIAELLTDSRTQEHIRETLYRNTKRMSEEDLKIAVMRAVGMSDSDPDVHSHTPTTNTLSLSLPPPPLLLFF
jgi:hypothetical protein